MTIFCFILLNNGYVLHLRSESVAMHIRMDMDSMVNASHMILGEKYSLNFLSQIQAKHHIYLA